MKGRSIKIPGYVWKDGKLVPSKKGLDASARAKAKGGSKRIRFNRGGRR